MTPNSAFHRSPYTAFAAAFSLGMSLTACASTAQAADQYQIDASHTHVVFAVERFGFNKVYGAFPEVSGVITLDPDNPSASSVTADIKTATLKSGDDTRDEHLNSEFWLNTGEFPGISFRSTSVEVKSDTEAAVTGDLTLLGKTLPVTMDVTLNKIGADPATKKQAAGFSATATLKRSDFGLETAMALIGDEVSIRIETLGHLVE